MDAITETLQSRNRGNMKLIIDIPEEIYKASQIVDVTHEDTIQIPLEVIANGTPIPDNATVGEVFCMLSNKRPICETASYFTIDKDLWDSPYQESGVKR